MRRINIRELTPSNNQFGGFVTAFDRAILKIGEENSTFILAPIATASFCEEERRAKDRVESGTSFGRSENLVAPKTKLHLLS